MIMEGEERVSKCPRLPCSRAFLFKVLKDYGHVCSINSEPVMEGEGEKFCEYHACWSDHDIEECKEFGEKLEEIHAAGLFTIKSHQRRASVNMIGEEKVVKPLIISYDTDQTHTPNTSATPLIITYDPLFIQTPTQLEYSDTHVVPWNYNTGETMSEEVSNLAGVGGMTRSGRCYTPAELAQKQKGLLEKEKKREVPEAEINEFLQVLKKSEYDVVEQLNKTPARISMLGLLLSSESHRSALIKVLNEAHVPPDVPLEKFESLVGSILTTNHIVFTDEEMPEEGRGHINALHISACCKNMLITKVLIDNGSALNVCPLSTLDKLSVDTSYIQPSHNLVVRAFDGTRREVEGTIELDVEIGPYVFNIAFQVLDIQPAFNMLLGRPWIHGAGAVPSTLHQKIKFVVDNRLTIIKGEEEHTIYPAETIPHIGAGAPETSFHSFEFVSATFVSEFGEVIQPQMARVSKAIARNMLVNDFCVGRGLGASLQGRTTPIELPEQRERFGLGYKPTKADLIRMRAKKREQRLAKLKGKQVKESRFYIPSIRQTFPKPTKVYESECMEEEQGLAMLFAENVTINVIDEEAGKVQTEDGAGEERRNAAVKIGGPSILHSSEPLNNWTMEIIPTRSP